MLARIFIALIEVRPQFGSAFDPSEVCGAAVRCYIPAATDIEAREQLTIALSQEHFDLVEIEFCHPADGEWHNQDGGDDAKGVDEARRSGKVSFGTFHTWGFDAPDALDEP